ncbi:MAG: hypothetical protein HQK77_10430, partial [Desulfobacterales bacterium]|nr:hypothetical protein [Desulfobacterales bacterium]
DDVQQLYINQRPYFGIVANDAAFFFVVGNHEAQSGWQYSPTPSADYPAVWAKNAQKIYYPNPIPDSFYTGCTLQDPALIENQLPENYYAFEWGDALFVILDAYWSKAGIQ